MLNKLNKVCNLMNKINLRYLILCRRIGEECEQKSTLNAAVIAQNDRFQEFVGLILGVAFVNDVDDAIDGRFLSGAGDQRFIRYLNALPTLIAIHGVVAADYCRQFSIILLLQEVERLLQEAD